MNRSFVDYYRCPEEFATFSLQAVAPEQVGYFRFGPEAICFGSLNKGAVQPGLDQRLHDALNDVVTHDGELHWPFDPDEIADNLRLERYCAHGSNRSFLASELANVLYYFARPLLGVSVRRHLQKLRLANWRTIPFPQWPVDRTVERVHETMMKLCLQARGEMRAPFVWFWPKAFTSCAVVTHDVETIKGRDFCSALMDVDDSFGIKSSFQLIPEKRYSLSPSFVKGFRERGFEVNVHDLNHDGRLFAGKARFLERASRINQYGRALGARGFRSGALYRNPDWYGALEFSYDMSVPNVAHLDPQRGGCCTVMPYFIGKVLELPVTTAQDYALFHILQDFSIDLWKLQIARIMETYGLASFIVHPDYVTGTDALQVYRALLAHLNELRSRERMWIALPNELDQWWRARSQMNLVRRGTDWVIEGPEKDRASVAYACLRDNKLTYEQVAPLDERRPLQTPGVPLMAG